MPVLLGLATAYTATPAAPLFCGGTFATTSAPFVALPVAYHGTGWQCGDLVYLRFADGSTLMARARDAGPLSRYHIADAPGVPIVVDVPAHWAPFRLSGGVEMYNVSAAVRGAG